MMPRGDNYHLHAPKKSSLPHLYGYMGVTWAIIYLLAGCDLDDIGCWNIKGVFNQLSQPSNSFARHSGKFYGYDQKGIRGSN